MDIIEKLFSLVLKKRYTANQGLFEQLSGLNYAVVKGEPLSYLAFGEYGRRKSSDIDILVPKESLQTVEKLLLENGYTSNSYSRADRVMMLAFSHQVAPYSKPLEPFGEVQVDLNFDLFWGEYTGKRIDVSSFLSDASEAEIYGVRVKALPPLKAMVQLILHHYKEMNSIYHIAGHNCINFDMFNDIYSLWKNQRGEITLNAFCDFCGEYEIMPYAFYVLYFTNQIFKDRELEPYIEALKTDEGVALLDCYGLSQNERKPWRVDFQARYQAENLYDFIKDDLTAEDIEKLNRNRRLFG